MNFSILEAENLQYWQFINFTSLLPNYISVNFIKIDVFWLTDPVRILSDMFPGLFGH